MRKEPWFYLLLFPQGLENSPTHSRSSACEGVSDECCLPFGGRNGCQSKNDTDKCKITTVVSG